MKLLTMGLVAMGLKSADAYASEQNIYQFNLTSLAGESVDMKSYAGKVLMIVNTASKCGFTSQYEGLQKVYAEYRDRGFTVLGFPSNDFGSQELDTDAEIKEFCQLNFGVEFPMFSRGAVKGDQQQEIFRFLTKEANPMLAGAIRWNFEKFLINREGQLVERYRSMTKPDSKSVRSKIESLLKN